VNQNLLIVDDEWEILNWLEELFRYDFDREIGVYKAGSAPEALELLKRVKFDAVLTDIRMPAIDGIALFRRIKENWPRCRVVFLTGYRDFDNVYELIRHKDIRYILKSEGDEVIQDAVRQALDEIELELRQAEAQKRRERRLEIARRWMRNDFLDRLLAGGEPRNGAALADGSLADGSLAADSFAGAAEDALQELGIPLNLDEGALAHLFLLRVDASSQGASPQGGAALAEDLAAVLLENLPEKLVACPHVREGRHVYLLVQPREKADWECALAIALGGIEYAQEVFRQTHGAAFSAVYEPSPVPMRELPEAASRLRQALVGFVGGNREMLLMIGSDDYRSPPPPAALSESVAKAPRLKALLELHKRKEYFDLLSDALNGARGKSRHDPFALELYYSISLQLLRFINDNSLNEQIAFKIGLYKLTRADEHAGWADAAQYLFDVSDAIFALLGDNEATLADRALSRVIAYIDENISRDLPLTLLANVGGFNASYLSRLFRQVTGRTITEHIAKKRIDHAKSLLENTAEKIQDVAAKSGYSSAHSFARAFRGAMGMSPVEYREMAR
jgi:two-component system response regulator YesN